MNTIIQNQRKTTSVVISSTPKETTYQKLKRLSKKYCIQTNDPKFVFPKA